ncbi:DUF3306 domain-containing protein [Shewanella polaris]|uniref:DUF3306 domain-containing protein n=1 Tax=Shewanella polaris TaxID=2588449 RepID=A0A4Y5Y9Q8_9GAMM|nr:DUF3306 domain-containing protein [Shewanella polaris]QDE29540.1 DUF3306 domain-containing protein [Shewanella polaris]
MNDKSEGLLNRWELRRQRVAEEAEQEALLQQAQAHADEISTPTTESTQDVSTIDLKSDEALESEPLPDPSTIEVGGSFARFMAKSVDPTTKAAALRALWKQPQYGHIDGLIEYALDYTNQPLLSADVSAELASKVFRYVVEKELPEPELEADLAPTDLSSTELAQAEIDEQTDLEVDEELNVLADENEQQIVAISPEEQPLSQNDDLIKQAAVSDEAKA